MNEIIRDYVDGSKRHLTSQCVYFAFRNIIIFGVHLLKKIIIYFQMKYFEAYYLLYR
jgi:hypothetical protein